MERRLSTVMLADIAGFSRLTEADEMGTLTRQKVHLAEVIEPALKGGGGEIVKTTGDGFLAVFPSVVEAVNAALAIQREIGNCEAEEPAETRLLYRIGVNLGDVIFDQGDVHGNGVNVAARLEAMADPGGICISGTAFDQLGAAVAAGYEGLGEVQVRNIAKPIRAYRVLMDPAQAGTVIEAPRRSGLRVPAAIAAAILLALIGGGIWWWQQEQENVFAGPCGVGLPDKPSIAVLAFDNLTGDPDMGYVGDGLSENITAQLALNPKLFVIARNSAFTYKGTATDVRTIAEELGVRYVLEGSIQSAGDRLRVTAQLIDSKDGQHIWADRYDADVTTTELFDIQDDIARRIGVSFDIELVRGTSYNESTMLAFVENNLDAVILHGKSVYEYQKFTPSANAQAEQLARQANELAPDFAGPMIMLAYAIATGIDFGQSDDPVESMAEAKGWARKAIELAPDDPHSHVLLGWLQMSNREHDAAVANADKAMQLASNSGIGASLAGMIYANSGQPQRGIEHFCLGMRTEPFFPGWMPFQMALALVMLDRLDEAELILDALLENGELRQIATLKAALLVLQGKEAQARALIEDVRSQNPWVTKTTAASYLRFVQDDAFRDRMWGAMRRAGVPE